MSHKPVRIADVARTAGVSTATVSRALSQPDKLTEQTLTRVMEAIHATGYRVNLAARNLRMSRAGAILLLVPDMDNPFFSRVVSGAVQALSGTDYALLLMDSRSLDPERDRLLDYFLDNRVDGMVTLDPGHTLVELERFRSHGLGRSIVFCCDWVEGADFPSVRSDNAGGTRLAVNHLHDLGHRRIALVSGPDHSPLAHLRTRAALSECARLGCPPPPHWVVPGAFTLTSGRDAARRLVALGDLPSAVVCLSDPDAFGMISGLVEAGLSVPGDISVVGFDDVEMAEVCVPPLTTIRQDRDQLGARAMQMLLQRLESKARPKSRPKAKMPPDPELIDVALVVRGSTGPAPD